MTPPLPPPTQASDWPATAALYAAIVAVAPEARHLSDRDRWLLLRDCVCAAVDELRGRGRTCERVVALVKLLAAGAGLDEAHTPEVIGDILAWCVQRYYGPESIASAGQARNPTQSS